MNDVTRREALWMATTVGVGVGVGLAAPRAAALALASGGLHSPPVKLRDTHAHMVEANRAQIVMLAEQKLVPAEQAQRIAEALRAHAAEQDAPGAERAPGYLDLEAAVAKRIGPDASNLHMGRSRNDLGETVNRMLQREVLLSQLDALAGVRASIHQLAADHTETVMPGYTHAVQAQPTTLAHFLLAFDAGLNRDMQRLREVYARVNLSPLGSGTFTTSGFALDRDRLAELLGFPALVVNAYDAIMVSSADVKVEFMAALGISALGIGRFAQYILFQYSEPIPGLMLTDAVSTRSSSMPQKRNPSPIERLRLAATEVVAHAHTSALFVHNTPLYEVKDVREDHLNRLVRFAQDARAMTDQLGQIVRSLTVNKKVLLAQVDRDYSTMTELADTLLREAGVPFRTGYQMASELTTYGRERTKRSVDFTHEEVDKIYRRITNQPLPLSADQLKRVFDAVEFVRSRQGRGGPQPAETTRMLKDQQAELAQVRDWVRDERERLQTASKNLHTHFEKLASP